MNWYGKRTIFVWKNKVIVLSQESDVIFLIFITLKETIHPLDHCSLSIDFVDTSN